MAIHRYRGVKIPFAPTSSDMINTEGFFSEEAENGCIFESGK